MGNSNKGNCNIEEKFIAELTEKFLKLESRSHKLQFLTSIPPDWGIKKMRDVFGISRRLSRQAKKLRVRGFAVRVEPKKGRPLLNSTIELVTQFFLSDEVSRALPGIKDVVSVVINGKREQKQKRLLLADLADLHKKFLSEHPEIKISKSKFIKLRPKQCISADEKGMHNVCVCKIHSNFKFKLLSLRNVLKGQNIDFLKSCQNFIEGMICENPTSECYFMACKECPGIDVFIQKLENILELNNILRIDFEQWIATDR